MLEINEQLRLRPYDGGYEFALEWYQDLEIVRLVDGENAQVYDLEKLRRMYECLNNKGELYFIEVKEGEVWFPIGDVAFWKEDMPIVIGNPNYRGKGIGWQVIEALKGRARQLGYTEIYVDLIFQYNLPSQKAFEKAGFISYKECERGISYKCCLI